MCTDSIIIPKLVMYTLLCAVYAAVAVMVAVREALSGLCDFSKEEITSALKSVSTTLDVPHRNTMQFCRAAVIGKPVLF